MFFRSNYSPVVNDVKICEIISEQDRFSECGRVLDGLSTKDKTLIYFPTVSQMYKYITDVIALEPILDTQQDFARAFIEWAKEEIHEEWCLVSALERGYLIHNHMNSVKTENPF